MIAEFLFHQGKESRVRYCLDPLCRKEVPKDGLFCPYCGNRDFSESQQIPDAAQKSDEISIENFQKIIGSTEAVKEKSVKKYKSKPSVGSRFAVRLNAIRRGLPHSRGTGWRPGQAARRRKFLVAAIVGGIAVFFVTQSNSSSVLSIKSQIVKVLPVSEAYKAGFEAGSTFRKKVNYNDEFINQWSPEMQNMLDQLGQSSANMTESMIGSLADATWVIAAFEAGIMENSAENQAEYKRGMIKGYFG